MRCRQFSFQWTVGFWRQLPLWILVVALVGCDEQIVHHLSESEANVLVTHLADVSVSSRKVRQADGSWAIAVDESDQLAALRALSAARLLRPTETREPEQHSFLVGREEQRFRHERALSAEVERTLTTIPAIVESRVHLNLPTVDPLFGQRLEKGPGSASVVVVVRGAGPSKEEIAQIVSGASGIPMNLVSVMVQQPLPPEIAAPELHTSMHGAKLPDATDRQDEGDTQRAHSFLQRNRNVLIQTAISLLILGAGLLFLFRRRRWSNIEPLRSGI